MSAEDEKDVTGEAAEEPKAQQKPAAKKAAAKKARAAKGESAAKAEGAAKAKPAAKKAPARKAAAKTAKEPAGETKAPAAKKASKAPAAEKPAAEKRSRERGQARTGPSRQSCSPKHPAARVVSARARYVRTSARKARMVCGHLRGKSVEEARAILAFTPREVARDWSKLLESAVANAESNHELLQDDLIVREAYADEGPTIKRFRPRAMGRATPIRKRTSHLTITLTPRPEGGPGRRKG